MFAPLTEESLKLGFSAATDHDRRSAVEARAGATNSDREKTSRRV
jgi:hypothetical protein